MSLKIFKISNGFEMNWHEPYQKRFNFLEKLYKGQVKDISIELVGFILRGILQVEKMSMNQNK